MELTIGLLIVIIEISIIVAILLLWPTDDDGEI